MHKFILCGLKNRTLIKVWGNESFKFLQSLSSNDLNKIISEKDFQNQRNFPREILLKHSVSSSYESEIKLKERKAEIVRAIPSLFLQSTGKIIFDCFIFKVKHTHNHQNFCIFYIDCCRKKVNSLIDLMKKRTLTYEIFFNTFSTNPVYQLLPPLSSLELPRDSGKKEIGKTIKENDLCKDFVSGYIAADERSESMGYRLYLLDDKYETNPLKENPKYVQDFTQKKTNNKNNWDTDENLYDFYKLHEGIIENLYEEDTYFIKTDSKLPREEKDCLQKEIKKISDREIVFNFNNLSPFDLKYDHMNYLVGNKGCYVGQESINRIRNQLLNNKYELCLCINPKYQFLFHTTTTANNNNNNGFIDSIRQMEEEHGMCMYHQGNLTKVPLGNASFLLFKNVMNTQKEYITHRDKYIVVAFKKEKAKNHKNGYQEEQNIIGNVFFYNKIMGICFLIKKRMNTIQEELFQNSIEVFILKKETHIKHRIQLIPFKTSM